jgi:hypothetical protein
MDPTVEFMWSRQHGVPISAAEWASKLLLQNIQTDAILRLTDPFLHWQEQQRFVNDVLMELGMTNLNDVRVLRREFEAESIADYFSGVIDGWTLILRGCELYSDDDIDDPDRVFWIQVAEDADGHGGQGIYAQWNFQEDSFDSVLRAAIITSGRPLKKGKGWNEKR